MTMTFFTRYTKTRYTELEKSRRHEGSQASGVQASITGSSVSVLQGAEAFRLPHRGVVYRGFELPHTRAIVDAAVHGRGVENGPIGLLPIRGSD